MSIIWSKCFLGARNCHDHAMWTFMVMTQRIVRGTLLLFDQAFSTRNIVLCLEIVVRVSSYSPSPSTLDVMINFDTRSHLSRRTLEWRKHNSWCCVHMCLTVDHTWLISWKRAKLEPILRTVETPRFTLVTYSDLRVKRTSGVKSVISLAAFAEN